MKDREWTHRTVIANIIISPVRPFFLLITVYSLTATVRKYNLFYFTEIQHNYTYYYIQLLQIQLDTNEIY